MHLTYIIFGYLISTKFLFKIFFFFLFFSFQNSKFYFYHRQNCYKFSSRSSSCTCNYINVQKHRTVIVNWKHVVIFSQSNVTTINQLHVLNQIQLVCQQNTASMATSINQLKKKQFRVR